MNEDLKWLAENVHEWPETAKSCYVDNKIIEWSPSYTRGYYTRSQWQAARDELAAQKEWRGTKDGLPPVGSCCEMEFTSGEWHEVKIEHYSQKHVIFTDQDGEERVEYMRSFKFRPIRTEEDKAVDEMMESGAIGAFYGAGGGAINDAAFEALFRQMFHAGYRKRGLI